MKVKFEVALNDPMNNIFLEHEKERKRERSNENVLCFLMKHNNNET